MYSLTNNENYILGAQKSKNSAVAIKYNAKENSDIPNKIKAHQEVLKAVKYTVHAKSISLFCLI